ncbi:MAG: efflux RND transporter periplasmic adaptor subunit [Candidatus Cryptobacteroides sp.]
MKRTELIAGIFKSAAMATALCAAACLTQSCGSRKTVQEKTAVVKIDTARAYGNAVRLEFPGKVTAANETNLAFQVAGKLKKIHGDAGTFIRKGQIIAELDDRDYKVQLNAVEAEYNSVKAEAERVFALFRDSATTAANYDKARYGLEQISAKYENCRNQLADTKITAPFDGYLQKTYYDAPAIVGAGMPVVCFISSGSPEVEISIPGSEYAKFRDYRDFRASFDFIPGKNMPLTLLSISPKANANQLYTVRFALSGTTRDVAPGMNTMVSMDCNSGDDGRCSIPSSALFNNDGRSRVWILGSGNTVSGREVRVDSLHADGIAVISEGLAPGDIVVTSGVHKIKDGEKVNILRKASETNIGGLL